MSGPDWRQMSYDAEPPRFRWGALALRACGVAVMEPALERRLMAFPEAQEYANNGHRNG
jgi:hypothetical protein